MTREEAIICLKGIKNYGRDTFNEQSDWQGCLDVAIKALEQEPKWIPVSERLPEKNGDYLVTQKSPLYDNTDYVYVSGYALNLHDVDKYDFAGKKRPGWYDYDREYGYYELDDVIAWMSLPEPYKEESEVTK